MADCKNDKDMEEMASEELLVAIDEEKRQQYTLLRSLLPEDDADERDCILEVRAGNSILRSWMTVNLFFSSLASLFALFLIIC